MKLIIQSLLTKALQSVVPELSLDDSPFTIERPKDANHGDFSTNVAMIYAKAHKMPPRQFAEALIAKLPEHEAIETVSIAGPGFINFSLKVAFIESLLDSLLKSKTLGVEKASDQATVVVDYSSPNLAKEMHVGHLRSTIIGDAIANILAFKGYHVIRQNHVGDWGTQFGMLIAHLNELNQADLAMELKDLETFYQQAKKRFDEDPNFAETARGWVVKLQSHDSESLSLWKKFIDISLAHSEEIYARLKVNLTAKDVRAESAYNDDLPHIVATLKRQGLLQENEGAQCVFLENFKGKDDEPLPIIVQKKDGGYLYATTDLAGIQYRQNVLKAHRVLYVVDARQSLHFQQVFTLAYLAHFADESLKLEHIGFGMVLDKSGKPFKTREGGVTKLNDLLDEAKKRALQLIASREHHFSAEEVEHIAEVVGIGSIKYADLSKNRLSDYMFDWDHMLAFEGNTAPYLLYAYTRINSIFKKIKDTEYTHKPITLTHPHEIKLAKQLLQFGELIDTVCDKATPHLLCLYLYELAGSFSSFYESCPILNQSDLNLRNSRLQLAYGTRAILKQGLTLLGIDTLDQM